MNIFEQMLVPENCDDVLQFNPEFLFRIASQFLNEGERMEVRSDHGGNLNIY